MTGYQYPDSHVFYRKLGHAYPKIVRGEGCWLIDERGKRYLDAVGGAYVANLGHSNPEIARDFAADAPLTNRPGPRVSAIAVPSTKRAK